MTPAHQPAPQETLSETRLNARMFSSSLLLTLSMMGFMVAGLVRHKAAAVWFGADGVGVLAQAAQLQLLLVALSGAGIATGARVLLAKGGQEGADAARQLAWIFWIPFMGSTVLAALAWLLAEPIASLVMGDSSRGPLVVAAVAGLPFAVGTQVAMAAAQAFRDLRRLLVASLASAVLSGTVVLLLMAQDSLLLGALSLVAAPFAQLLFIVIASPTLRTRLFVRPSLPRAERRLLLAVTGASFVLGTSAILGDSVSRAAVVGSTGIRAIGEFQPAAVISGQLFSVVLGALAATAMVDVGRHRERADLGRQLSVATRDVALLVTAIAATISALKNPLVRIMFDTGFGSSMGPLLIALAAEPLRCVAWLTGAALLPLGHQVRWLAIGIGSVVVQTSAVLLTLETGAWALAYGVFAGTAFAAVATIASLRKTRVRISRGALLTGWGAAVYILLTGVPELVLGEGASFVTAAMALAAVFTSLLVGTRPEGFLYPLWHRLLSGLRNSVATD